MSDPEIAPSTTTTPSPVPMNGGGATGEPWVPLWLVRLGAIGWRLLVVLALGLVLLLIAWTIGTVTASVALALIVSAAFAPLVIRLRARGWARTKAAAVATLIAVGIVGFVLAVAAAVLIQYGPEVIAAVESGLAALRDWLAGASVPPEISDAIDKLTESLKSWLASSITAMIGNLSTMFTVLLFGTFTTFFLLQDADRAWAWAMQAASERRRGAATASAVRALRQVGGYIRTVAVLAAVEAAVDYVFLVVLGVPLALPLATLVFVGGFIPYLGGLVATAVVLSVALGSIGAEATIVLLILIVVANIFEDRFIGRVGRLTTVRIHPAIVLVALPIGAVAAGLFGLIVAVPIAAFALAISGSITEALSPDPTDQPDDGPTVVPDWLDVLAQWSWRLLVGIALLTVVVAAVVQVPTVLMPILLAAVLASTFAPLMRALMRRGLGTSVSAGVVTIGTYVGIAAIIGLTLVALVANVDEIAGSSSDGAGSITLPAGALEDLFRGLVESIGIGLLDTVPAIASLMFGISAIVILGAVLTFFFLRDGQAAWAVVAARMAPWRRQEADAAAGRAVSVLGGYMIGTGAISAFGALTQLVIMTILGIPLALPLAVLSFFGGFIPYIGSFVTTGLAFLVTVATGSPTDIAVMAVFTLVFNVVQGNIVAPLVYGRAVNIHPAIVLLAIPAGSAVAGVLGMFLVVPFIGVVATTWRTVLALMGEQPPSPVPSDPGEGVVVAPTTDPDDGGGGQSIPTAPAPDDTPGEEATGVRA